MTKQTIKCLMMKNKFSLRVMLIAFGLIFFLDIDAFASNFVDVDINGSQSDALEIIMLLTILALLPSIVIMMTSFTRIVIVLSFLRNAMGIQQTPPNQVLLGIALFLTLFIMSPVIDELNVTAYQPYVNEEISQEEFYDRMIVPIKSFMISQTGRSELDMFISLSQSYEVLENQEVEELPLTVIIPAFMTSELRRAFIIGFIIFIPFLIVDTIVSTVLMSMGMMMLPPVMISLPFKIALFVLVDGWSLLFRTLVLTFNI